MTKIIKEDVVYSNTIADGVAYNNISSGLNSTNVQAVIDEVSTKIDNLIAITKSYTIEVADWDINGTYTIEDELITIGTNESTQTIGYNPNLYDDNLYKELCAASIRISNVSNGEITLKCMGDLPTHTLPITVTFGIGAQPVELTVDSTPTSGSNNAISSDGVKNYIDNKINEPVLLWSGDVTTSTTITLSESMTNYTWIIFDIRYGTNYGRPISVPVVLFKTLYTSTTPYCIISHYDNQYISAYYLTDTTLQAGHSRGTVTLYAIYGMK